MFRFFLILLTVSLFYVCPRAADAQTKLINIDLSNQRLTAYEDGVQKFDFFISSGKMYPTPKGDFTPWIKVTLTRMTGGDRRLGTYYDLPNVPNVIFFYNSQYPKSKGYSIHGAYWHNNFGTPMSHGCVNVRPSDMVGLYHWADLNTMIHIF